MPTSSRPTWIEPLDDLHLLTPLRILAIIIVAIVVAVVLRTLVTRVLQPHRSGSRAPTAAAPTPGSGRWLGVALGGGRRRLGDGGHHDHRRARRQHRRCHRHRDRHRWRDRLRRADVDPRRDRRAVRARRGSVRRRRQRRPRPTPRARSSASRCAACGYATARAGSGTSPTATSCASPTCRSRRLSLLDLEVSPRQRSRCGRRGRRVVSARSSASTASAGPALTGDPTIVGFTEVRDDRLVYQADCSDAARPARRGAPGLAPACARRVPRGRVARAARAADRGHIVVACTDRRDGADRPRVTGSVGDDDCGADAGERPHELASAVDWRTHPPDNA